MKNLLVLVVLILNYVAFSAVKQFDGVDDTLPIKTPRVIKMTDFTKYSTQLGDVDDPSTPNLFVVGIEAMQFNQLAFDGDLHDMVADVNTELLGINYIQTSNKLEDLIARVVLMRDKDISNITLMHGIFTKFTKKSESEDAESEDSMPLVHLAFNGLTTVTQAGVISDFVIFEKNLARRLERTIARYTSTINILNGVLSDTKARITAMAKISGIFTKRKKSNAVPVPIVHSKTTPPGHSGSGHLGLGKLWDVVTHPFGHHIDTPATEPVSCAKSVSVPVANQKKPDKLSSFVSLLGMLNPK